MKSSNQSGNEKPMTKTQIPAPKSLQAYRPGQDTMMDRIVEHGQDLLKKFEDLHGWPAQKIERIGKLRRNKSGYSLNIVTKTSDGVYASWFLKIADHGQNMSIQTGVASGDLYWNAYKILRGA